MSANHRMNGLTDYFFAMPSFWSGMGRALDFGGTFDEYNWTDDPWEDAATGMFCDFRAVGLDITAACSRFEDELGRTREEPDAPR